MIRAVRSRAHLDTPIKRLSAVAGGLAAPVLCFSFWWYFSNCYATILTAERQYS
jgi:hypothetical protein